MAGGIPECYKEVDQVLWVVADLERTMAQYEKLGFCPEGEGGPFAESGATAIGGKIPVNTSGGLISRGHPIGASGLAMTHELTTQLRGEAGKRQVKNARIAMAENGGGTLGLGEASVAVHIFEKP